MKKRDYLLMAFLIVLLGTGILSCIGSCCRQVSAAPSVSLPDSRTSVDIPVLMYHSISKDASGENEYTISSARFE